MTEDQRMEEGRRMFQIFAARMFEQRVLAAYRKTVADERSRKFIQELNEEERQQEERKAKKAKDAQRRKEKLAKKKEQLAEEKARKEAEKAAEAEAARAEEARRAEELRQKNEDRRKRREALKKAEEEGRQRKEAERLRRIHEREEAERKAREAKEKQRDEARLKEKEHREQREREARERREQQERDKRDKEARARANREAAREAKEAKEAREAKEREAKEKEVKEKDRLRKEKERPKKEDKAAQKTVASAPTAPIPIPISLPKRPAQPPVPTPVPALPQQLSGSYSSPKIPVATPALPKAPTPMRARQASQQESSTASSSHSASASGLSQNPSPHPITPVHASPGPMGQPGKRTLSSGISMFGGPHSPSHPASPPGIPAKMLPHPPGSFGPPPGMSFPPGMSHPPGFGGPGFPGPIMPSFPLPAPNAYRGPTMPPPGFGGQRFAPPPPGYEPALPNMAPGYGMPKDSAPSHSRQGSGNFEPMTPITVAQPIARPTPIARPPSVVQRQSQSQRSGDASRPEHEASQADHDAPLGSSVLLEGSDDPFETFSSPHRIPPVHPGALGPGGLGFGSRPVIPMSQFSVPPFQPDPLQSLWGAPPPPQQSRFPLPPHASHSPWGHGPLSSSFGGPSMMPPSEPPTVLLRKALCRACEHLASNPTVDSMAGFVSLHDIKVMIHNMIGGVEEKDILILCDTEGNHANGGGSFEMREDEHGRNWIRFDRHGPPKPAPIHRAVGAPGEIGASTAARG